MCSLLSVLIVFTVLYINGVTGDPIHDLTHGFVSTPLNSSHLDIQRPYNLPRDSRYSFINGTHKFWVLSTDKPLSRGSPTVPRSEIQIRGYDYSAGVWQFRGELYIPSGTSGVSIMQVFGGTGGHATSLMLRVYNGALMYYRSQLLADDIYGKWIKVNVIHDANAHQIKVYLNDQFKLETRDNGGNKHYFKFGVYTQKYSSYFAECIWKEVTVSTKIVN